MTYEHHQPTSEKIKAIIVTIIYCLVGIYFIIIRCCYNRSKSLNTKFYSKKWSQIRQLSSVEEARPLAIIYANSLLDAALIEVGYFGETLSERLKAAEGELTNIKKLRRIVEKRNKIAHDIEMKSLSEQETNQALKVYRQALVDLGEL
ncbi:unnamed protein product [Adineta steineri]|uniref:DUF4145 domain-containing protein n=1 Tax=Adineta steineri TaxID=433720 RepID=A0A819NHP8_9BILA|nr:unnamed protein product [Adineta steineri]